MATYESKKYAIPGANITDIDATAVADGSVSDSEYQFINSLTSNAQTQITARLPLAGGTMTGDLNLGDNVDINFGDSADLKIFHDGSDSIIADAGTGALEMRASALNVRNAADTQNIIQATEGGAVTLYHNNSAKIATASGGVSITGTATATTFSGSGASLTSLPAGNLTGTVADARISTLTASKLTGALPAIDGSALTGISVAPANSTAIGSLREFQFRTNVGNVFNSVSVSQGTDITFPYSVSGMGLKDGSDVQTGTFFGRHKVGTAAAFTGGSNATFSGTWRCFKSPKTGSFVTGGGQNAVTNYYSLPGLFQRVS